MPTALTFAIRAVSLMALAALWLLASAEPSQACSCLPHGSPSESLASATEVFQGVVTSVHMYDRGGGIWASNDPVTMEFDVSVVWKGQVGNSITIKTVRDSESCGRPLGLGGEYIVYSYGGGIGLCDRTHQVGRAGYNDREELGPGRAPDPTIATPTPEPTVAPPTPKPTAAPPTPKPTAAPTAPSPTAAPPAPSPPAVGGCGRASSGADIWWAALAVGAAWMGSARRR